MIKMSVIVIGMLLIFSAGDVSATPPQEITLTYDQEAETLTIEIEHVSQRMLDHYIRKIEIWHNGTEHESIYLKKQDSPNGLTKDVSLTAEPGDVISIKAYCAEGGTKEASLTVEEIPEEASPKVKAEDQPTTSEPAQQPAPKKSYY